VLERRDEGELDALALLVSRLRTGEPGLDAEPLIGIGLRVVRDGATYERVTYRKVRVGPNVKRVVEQVIGVRDPAAALGTIRNLTFDDVTAPTFTKRASNWTWYTQFRPARPRLVATVNAFERADELHAIDGLRLKGLVVNGQHLRDAATARRVANLSVGQCVRNATFESR
jgi:hypothetical protein